jgi:hypothetical protein
LEVLALENLKCVCVSRRMDRQWKLLGLLAVFPLMEVELDKRPLHESWTPLGSTIPHSLVI